MSPSKILTTAQRIDWLLSGAEFFRDVFMESSPEEIARFAQSWRSPEAIAERDKLYLGKCSVSRDVLFIWGCAKKWEEQNWPMPDPTREDDGKIDFVGNEMMLVGSRIARWIQQGEDEAFRLLADLVSGRKELQPKSLWKSRLLDEFLRLCMSFDCRRLPTKKELREAVESLSVQGEGIDDKDFRTYQKALGFAGLPSSRGGRKSRGNKG